MTQWFLYIPRHHCNHCTGVLIAIIVVKCFVIPFAVGKLHIDRRIAMLHEEQIHNQPACPAVAVHKRVDSLKFQMEQRCTLNRVQLFFANSRIKFSINSGTTAGSGGVW